MNIFNANSATIAGRNVPTGVGYAANAGAGMVLTGGSSALRGIQEVAEEIFQMPVQVCRAHLAQHPTSAEGYYLLGVLSSALGQTEAATAALRRALYLEAGHTGALLHLAVMQASGGDVSGAARLRRRAAARTETGR